jgi:hypothetical protein
MEITLVYFRKPDLKLLIDVAKILERNISKPNYNDSANLNRGVGVGRMIDRKIEGIKLSF